MKTALKISVWLNLVLITGLILLVSALRETVDVLSPPASATKTASGRMPLLRPFQWSQIESTNYIEYIKNLREIGCPEQTIRDLIAADVGNLYDARGENLKLAAEKAALIEFLLATNLSTTVNASVPASLASESKTLPSVVDLQLVFREVDVAQIHLEPEQLAAVIELRQKFLDKLGDVGGNPDDPAYLNAWQKAQPEVDEAFAGMLGRKAYLEYEALAAGQAE